MNQTYLENLCSDKKCIQEYQEVEVPYISNVNEDNQLSDTSRYTIDNELIKIGKKGNEVVKIDIKLNGLGINPHHCNIIKQDDKFYIDPLLKQNGDYLYVNGENVYQVQQIFQNDRIIIGLNNVFIVKLKEDLKVFEYEFIQEEFQTKQKMIKQLEYDKIMKEQKEEIQKLKDEMFQIKQIEIQEME